MIKKRLLILAAMLVMALVTPGAEVLAATNLLANPSAETSSGGMPTNWSQGQWGTNTSTFSYLTSGAQDGTHALGITTTGYSSGDAKWIPDAVTVTPNTQYTLGDWYQSTVSTEVDAVVTDTSGNDSYHWLGSLGASSSWTQTSYNFTTPANAAKMTIYHVIAGNGTLKTDNYSLTTATTPPPPPAGGNVIPNPGLETVNGTGPQSWNSDSWGTNTPTFSYLNTGHTGSHSVKVSMSSYTNGSANWDYAPVAVTAGNYLYTDWYKSNVNTEIDAAVTMQDGTTSYYYVANVPASTNWAQVKAQFSVPAGATQIAIYHLLAAKGSLTTDDYSFTPYTPTPLNRGLVSVTLDDGWTNQYTNAAPIMSQNSVPGTFYIISGELTDQPDYMSGAQVQALKTAGHEIGSHTVTHPDLTTLSTTQLTNELANSQTTLGNLIGSPVTSFAYPFGAYNATTITKAKAYYASQRTVDSGYNTKDLFDATKLKVQNVVASTTPAQVQVWINQATQDKSWLILVYHEVANTPTDPTDVDYTTTPADFATEMTAVKNSTLGKMTVNQALSEITSQL
jgi:peptidoglycan/xylan/chitin deacetylase (PgdA/CDA1 family)